MSGVELKLKTRYYELLEMDYLERWQSEELFFIRDVIHKIRAGRALTLSEIEIIKNVKWEQDK